MVVLCVMCKYQESHFKNTSNSQITLDTKVLWQQMQQEPKTGICYDKDASQGHL